MNSSVKLNLFWRLGRRAFTTIFIFIVMFSALYAIYRDGSDREALLVSLGISVFALIVATLIVWLKTLRGLLAASSGRRIEATVLGINVNSEGEGEPVYFVLSWKDVNGLEGSSVPDTESSFADFEPGDRIVVYANSEHESWWERDIFGPSIRSVVRKSVR